MSQCGNNNDLALQHGWFCTTWSLAAKGLYSSPPTIRIGLGHKEFSSLMESKGRKGQCLYNKKWVSDPQYKGWVRAFKADKRRALCQWCDWTIDVSSMDESALKSHSKSEKHKQNNRCEQRVTLSSFGIFELHEGLITCSRYVQFSGRKSPSKNVICPWKVLENYLKRKVSGLYEPWTRSWRRPPFFSHAVWLWFN